MLVFKKILVSTTIADCRSKLDVTEAGPTQLSRGSSKNQAETFSDRSMLKCRLDRQRADITCWWIDSAIAPQATDSYARQASARQLGSRPHLGSATYQINQTSIVIG